MTCQLLAGSNGDYYNGCQLVVVASKTPVSDELVANTPVVASSSTVSSDLPAYPAEPYIARNSELITIPMPVVPNMATSRSNCPHLEKGLLDWHTASTWGGSVPSGSGQDVTLPENTRVLIGKSVSVQLGVISIPSTSELIIGENSDGITLDVRGMDVIGNLTAGSENCRLREQVTITLHGARPSDAVTNPRDPTYKGISVTGTLHLHGKRYFRTWTRLAKTVNAGESILMLQDAVNWDSGQEIVLVTTAMKDSREWHQNEVLTVSALHPSPPSGVGAVVYLTSAVQHTHVAIAGYQAEVGLLTRTIQVQGAPDDSEPTDPDPLNCTITENRYLYGSTSQPCPNTELTGFGGHIMIHDKGRGHVEGVELVRMGQTNVIGRYPFHFHLLGECPECYFRDCSIHHSFYRCVSIHGTNRATVTENVAYDVVGYCYYLEDGVEQDNEISFNLAAHIHYIGPVAPWGEGQSTDKYQKSDTLTLPADVTASGFYITNVHNNIIGNAASGVSQRCPWLVACSCKLLTH
jgi:hypothetical protein